MNFARTLQAATGSLGGAQSVATTHAGHIGSGSAGLSGGKVARRAALRHRRADQPRPQHRRHGPRAGQLRRQRGQVRKRRCASSIATVKTPAVGDHRSIRSLAMSMLSIFNVSGSAASAQSQRLNVVASNLANADTVAGPDGQRLQGAPGHVPDPADGRRPATIRPRPGFGSRPSPRTRRPDARSTTPSIRAPTPRATSPTATSTRSRRWST